MPRSRYICCVPECPMSTSDGVALHYFPNPEIFPERFQIWVNNIGGDIAIQDFADIYKTQRICRRHFSEQFLYNKNRLSKQAIPTLHLPSHDITEYKSPICPETPVIQHPPTSRTVEYSSDMDSQPSTSQGVPTPVIQQSSSTVPIEYNLGNVSCKKEKDGVNEINELKAKLDKAVEGKKTYRSKYLAMLSIVANMLSKTNYYKILTKKYSPTNKTLFLMRTRERGNNNNGRNVDYYEKVLALSLYKSSPEAMWIVKKRNLENMHRLCQIIVFNPLKQARMKRKIKVLQVDKK